MNQLNMLHFLVQRGYPARNLYLIRQNTFSHKTIKYQLKVTRALVWSSVKRREGLVGEGLGVVLYAVKINLVCGLMLKQKLLPLMIELVVIVNHSGVMHL